MDGGSLRNVENVRYIIESIQAVSYGRATPTIIA